MKITLKWWLALWLAALLAAGCGVEVVAPESPVVMPEPAEGILAVHFLDVGQGDATLLMGPDFTILIDAGRHDRNEVVPYLEQFGVEELDLLVGTHPHADHIGQMDKVLARFPVGEVWMSGETTNSQTFERVIDAIDKAAEQWGTGYHEPRVDDMMEVYEIGSATVEVVGPKELTGHLNDGSVALRIVFGDVALLFTGDAETRAEATMVALIDEMPGYSLQADVLQVGHHGSRTSSTPEFLAAVEPQIAIWSAGADNSYGHPHPEVLNRLACLGITVYGTADHGTISAYTDGVEVWLEADLGDGRHGPPTPVPAACEQSGAGCSPGQIDINHADADALPAIMHIDPARARALIDLRPFASVEDLVRINGIGQARLADILAEGVACVQ